MKPSWPIGLAGAVLALFAGRAQAAPEPPHNAVFALIVGVNRSVDADLKPLRYADDDAVRYQELFRSLGAKTVLLATLDQETSALSPQAAAEALPPTHASLAKAVSMLSAEIATARARGVKTSLYVLYAGHGNVDGERAYLTLEDARLDGAVLGHEILDAIGADQNHLIVDACYSYFLVGGRGPGGERRPVQGFSALSELGRRNDLGLLLSTSTGNESHEWGAFEAGVFSHEVRSGLYGAADFDGDGRISYAEMAAFLERANQAIVNEKFRPKVFARAPTASWQLIDLRPSLGRSLTMGERFPSSHYLVEDQRGVRVLDFHNAKGRRLRLVRPGGTGNLYLRRLADDQELTVPPADNAVDLTLLAFADPRVTGRGAAHQAFSLIFSLPFDQARPDLVATAAPPARATKVTNRNLIVWSLGAASAVGAVVGGVLLWDASRAADEGRRSSQQRTAELNNRIGARNTQAAVAFALAGAALTAGTLTWLFSRPHPGQGGYSSDTQGGGWMHDDEHPAENSADRSAGRRVRSAIVSAWSMQVGLGPTQVNLSARF